MPSEIYDAIIATLDGCLTLPEDDLVVARDKMNAVHGHPIDADTEAYWTEFGGVRCATVTASNTTNTLPRCWWQGFLQRSKRSLNCSPIITRKPV